MNTFVTIVNNMLLKSHVKFSMKRVYPSSPKSLTKNMYSVVRLYTFFYSLPK